MQFAVKRLLKK